MAKRVLRIFGYIVLGVITLITCLAIYVQLNQESIKRAILKKVNEQVAVKIYGVELQATSSFKYLGVTVD